MIGKIFEVFWIIFVGIIGSLPLYEKYGFEAGIFGTLIVSSLFVIRQNQSEIKKMLEEQPKQRGEEV